jgi:hypothetical protein
MQVDLTASHSDLHERIIGSLEPRPWHLNGSPLDNRWTVRLGDQPGMNAKNVMIDFDQLLTGWPTFERLTDPKHVFDLINLKLIIYKCLESSPIGWIRSGHAAVITFNKHLIFVRWKLDRGIQRNSVLSAAWYNEYHLSLRTGRREGLLRLVPKAQALLKAYDEGRVSFPEDDRGNFKANAIAQMLGHRSAASLTTECKNIFVEHFAERGQQFTRLLLTPRSVPDEFATGTMVAYFRPWYDYWKLKEYFGHDPIGYKAFGRTYDISKVAKGWTRPVRRTPDIPEYQAAYLMNAALKILLSDVVEDAIKLMAAIKEKGQSDIPPRDIENINKKLLDLGCKSLTARYCGRGKSRKAFDLRWFLYTCVPACVRVLMAGFGARRDAEMSSTKNDCIDFDSFNEPWLRCYIAKASRKEDRTPIPMSVVRGVEILRKIKSLSQNQGEWLFEFRCPLWGTNIAFRSREAVRSLAQYVEVPLLDNGEQWRFNPHQFRRFFGVTYFWRWAFPNLTALTLHYRHFNPDTTRAYIELSAAETMRRYDQGRAKERRGLATAKKVAARRKADVDAGAKSFTEWVIGNALEGQSLGGALGKRIQAQVDSLKELLQPQLQVGKVEVDGKSFEDGLDALFSTISLRTHPEGHSVCGMRNLPEDKNVSVCLALKEKLTGVPRQSAIGADCKFADDEGCLVCPLRVSLPQLSPYWDDQVTKAKEAYEYASEDARVELRKRIALITEFA